MRATAMGSLRTATVATLLAGITLSACASEDLPGPGDDPDPSRTYIITYSAVETGDGVWNQIQYDNGEGSMIPVPPPLLSSWTTQFQVKEGDNVFITAQGAVSAGALSITGIADDGGDNTVAVGDSKTGDGTTTIYDLATTPVTLP